MTLEARPAAGHYADMIDYSSKSTEARIYSEYNLTSKGRRHA